MPSGNTEFYEARHEVEGGYGNMQYPVSSLVGRKGFGSWLNAHKKKSVSLLDVGCGHGVFLAQLKDELSKRSIGIDQIMGTDLIPPPPEALDELNLLHQFAFHHCDLEAESLPFEDGQFDFVSCNHVMEHIFKTEHLTRELCRVVKPNGLVLISVPNVGAWMNRVLFLFGCQPIGTELGAEAIHYGVRPKWLKERWKTIVPAGHIRDFTMRGLKDLAESCGLEHLDWWNHDDIKLLRFPAGMGRKIGALCQPQK